MITGIEADFSFGFNLSYWILNKSIISSKFSASIFIGLPEAQGDEHAAKMSTVAAIDAIVRIVCKRFHGFSNPSLTCAISLPEALVTSNLASLWFKGTFPTIVRANEPAMYRTEEAKSRANCIEFVSF